MKQKYLFNVFALAFVFVLAFLGHQQSASASEVKLTEDLQTDSTSYSVSWNKWQERFSAPFTLRNGDVTTEGFGLKPYYSNEERIFAEFYIGDFDITTLDTTMSLDEIFTTGDLGESEVAIYADQHLIYTKHITNKTKLEHIKASIPANSKVLTFYMMNVDGTKDSHGVIFSEPKLTNELPEKKSAKSFALLNLGATEQSTGNGYDLFTKHWGDDRPFQDSKGRYIARAVAFKPYYKSTNRMFAIYNISDYNYTTLETAISLDNAYRIGDLGESQVEIYADHKRIYSKKFTNKTGIQQVKASIPKGTTYLKIFVVQDKGLQGNHRIILDNPLLTNTNAAVKKTKAVELRSIGTSEETDYSVYWGDWNDEPFKMKNGQMTGMAYAFWPYYTSTNIVSAKFYIGDYSYKKFKTTFSVDKNYSTGSRGSTTVQVYAGSKKIYSKKFTNSTKVQTISLNVPKKTKNLTIKTIYKRGANDKVLPIIMDNPLLTN